jgi:UTP--glucose-1-phosphate uridylyltransferase
MNNPIRTAVFPVGGLGTRFLPATKAMPKEMLPVVDKPLIQYAVEEAREAGIEQFIFVTGRGKTAIEDHFDDRDELSRHLEAHGKEKEAELRSLAQTLFEPGQAAYVRQREPLGLGHAVWCARNLVQEQPFAVLLADDLIMARPGCLKQMVSAHADRGGNLVAVMEVPREQTGRYGIVDIERDGGRFVSIRGLVEKPAPVDAPSNLSVIGRYILQPEVFEHLARREAGAGGEIQLTDALARMVGHGPFHGLRFDGVRFDCGDKVGFLEANLAFALERDDMREDVREIMRRYLARGGGATTR